MATFPAKTNYAAGNVLTAAQMVDIGDQLNALSYAAACNPVLNSSMQIWQRGTTFTDPAGLTANTADRWIAYIGASGRTISRQATNDTTNLPFIQYCLRYQRNSGTTNTNAHYLITQFETINTIPYAGQTVTLSFYARKGAGYSTTDGTGNQLQAAIRTSTSIDGNSLAGPWANNAQPVYGVTTGLSSTWQRYSFTGTLSTAAQSMSVQIFCQPTGTAGANDYFEITGIQIDVGSVALPFRTYSPTLAGELAACQRYYWRITNTEANFPNLGSGYGETTTAVVIVVQNPVPMRVKPTSFDSSGIVVYDGASAPTISTVELNSAGILQSRMKYTVTGATQYRPYIAYFNGANTFFGLNAEL